MAENSEKLYQSIENEYLEGRSLQDLTLTELKELCGLLDIDINRLPRSYRTRQWLIVTIKNWIAIEIISERAKQMLKKE